MKNNNHFKNWTENDVSNWLNDKKFNDIIYNNVYPSDGSILFQLYLMNKNTPEFFNYSITSKQQIKTVKNKKRKLKKKMKRRLNPIQLFVFCFVLFVY
jgi:hypothetical protein